MTARTCVSCGHSLRARGGRWVHDTPRGHLLDNHHRPVLGEYVPPRPRLLDLCCKAGGATKGYQRAGFHVTGVDIEPQPNYCGDDFIQADALEFLASLPPWDEFDVVHASWPCQLYIRGGLAAKDGRHPNLLPPGRDAMIANGTPWVIENVPGAPMRADVMLCGSMFGLEVRRHRWFEFSTPPTVLVPPCDHSRPVTGVYGHPHGDGGAWPGMLPSNVETWSRAMGIDWMTAPELADAVPPAYTEFIGGLLLAALTTERCEPQQNVVTAPPPTPRKPRRSIIPLPEPVRWGRQEPIEKRAFNAETTRRRGCEVAAGIQLLGEL